MATGQQNKPMETLTNAKAIEKNCNNSRTGTNCRVQRQSGKPIIMTAGQVERFTWRWRPRGRGGALSCVPLARAKSDCDCESKRIFMETLESRSGETTLWVEASCCCPSTDWEDLCGVSNSKLLSQYRNSGTSSLSRSLVPKTGTKGSGLRGL